jgi:acyl-CoA synthetase (AMP-forming)/AMP-acid ligase II
MTMNMADMWEAVADTIPDALAQIHGGNRCTYSAFEQRSARLAGALRSRGVGPGDKVGMFLFNANEYLETVFAALKLRAVPVNVNFRYLADELHYLLENAEAKALVYHGGLAARVQEVRGTLPDLRTFIQVATTDEDRVALLDGADEYEEILRRHDPAERIERSPDDYLFLYTGGTTGLPKGVMWKHADLYKTLSKGFAPLGDFVPSTPAEIAEAAVKMHELNAAPRGLASAPLMHGMAWFTSMGNLITAGTVLSLSNRSFDPHELWGMVEREKASTCVIVGDAFARPMVEALEEAERNGKPYDISSLFAIISGGVMWTPPYKKPFLDRGVAMLIDGLGSSEAPGIAMKVHVAGDDLTTGKFEMSADTKVVTDDGGFVEPGSEEIGMLALGSGIPSGYYKDEEKTASTFRTIDGIRYAIPGDFAKIETDGTITLLGRGSVCINTGGEKVFPEEVEEALKLHASVKDCTVVGLADDKWGQAITAVVAPEAGQTVVESELIDWSKQRLSAFKAPKHVVVVDSIMRSPAGKADYRWAKEIAEKRLGS